MKELTEVTTTVLLQLRSESDNPVYKQQAAGSEGVHEIFRENRDDLIEDDFRCDILTMRAILANDVTVIKEKKDYLLVLTSEVGLYEQIKEEKQLQKHSRLNKYRADTYEGDYLTHFRNTGVKITAQVPEHAVQCFLDDCADCGHHVEFGHHVYLIDSKNDRWYKRWYSITIEFTHNPKIDLPLPDNKIHNYRNNNKRTVYSNEWAGYLLSQGFTFGNNYPEGEK